ncbi:MAG: hypothetical protein J6330_03965 [Clostridia bacterium]|nr:hypothetical protein [Clostridia bacterium]
MNTVKIINPAAGKGKAVKEISDDCKYYVSKGVGDVERYVTQTLLKEPYTHFIICGGDGTINEAVNGVIAAGAGETAVLSAIGDGTGNDLLRYECGSDEPVRCDVIKFNDRYYINILNIGFDCTVVQKTEYYKKKPLITGSFAYICGVVNTFVGNYGLGITVKATKENGEEEIFDGEYMLCVAANARYYGGGFKPAPLADLTDGLIDVLLVRKVPRKRFPSVIAAYKKGEHMDKETGDVVERFKDIMTYRRCTKLSISGMESLCADGEISKCSSVQIEIVPKAVNFLFK